MPAHAHDLARVLPGKLLFLGRRQQAPRDLEVRLLLLQVVAGCAATAMTMR
jgi:hypothetical protein